MISLERSNVPRRAYQRLRLTLLLYAYFLAILWGMCSAVPPGSSLARPCLAVGLAYAFTLLCMEDARLRGTPLVHSAQCVMLFTWPVAVPAYFTCSRGPKGILLVLLNGFLLGMAWLAGVFTFYFIWVLRQSGLF